jgi:protein-disulfide isomerase
MRFNAEMHDHLYLQRIRDHIRGGEESGVRATPTFFVDGKLQDVSYGINALFDAVQGALKR